MSPVELRQNNNSNYHSPPKVSTSTNKLTNFNLSCTSIGGMSSCVNTTTNPQNLSIACNNTSKISSSAFQCNKLTIQNVQTATSKVKPNVSKSKNNKSILPSKQTKIVVPNPQSTVEKPVFTTSLHRNASKASKTFQNKKPTKSSEKKTLDPTSLQKKNYCK